MADSTIEWTDKTWNPTTGCTKISPGCKNCYAEVMAKRLQAMGQYNYREGDASASDAESPLKLEKGSAYTLNSDTSRPFDKPKKGRIAVKVINHLGDEVMKVFKV